MKLLAAALLLLPLSVCRAEVVDDFTVRCPGFFATPSGVVSPPTRLNGPRYRQICQTRNGRIEFATFYDTANKIPVYSAYRFHQLGNCSRKTGNWFIEPQLDDQNLGNDMASESAVSSQRLGLHQAVNGDYVGQGYDKGHLAPVYHQNLQDCATATFTLTNAAPQHYSFNRGQWRVAEENVGNFLNTNCRNLRVFIVTGVVPGAATVPNTAVRVPSHFWSAFCCLDNNHVSRFSGGYIGINNMNNPVQNRTRQQLEAILTALYGQNFIVFGGGC